MNFQPPPPAARHLSVSRVWPCSSCGYLAQSDISSAVCPNCGHIGLEGSNVDSEYSPGELQTETRGIAPLSVTEQQDVKTSVTRSPDSSTLFIPATEDSSNVWLRIRSHLDADLSVIFGEFPNDLFGSTAAGYLIRAPRPITEQDMADLGNSFNSPPTDNFAADDNLPYPPLPSHDPAGMFASVSATLSSKAEQHEDWEIVDPLSNDSKDLRAASVDMPAPDIKSSDTKALEPLDTRYSLITKPQRFFKVGRVFMTLWSEPASSTARDGPNFSSSTIGGRIFSETRRFVVVRSGQGYALCCPIQTYQKRGTTKSRINVGNHAIVYASGSEPKLLPEEESLAMGSFQIVMEDKSVTIDQSSRLNFGKVYTVEHNIKVRNVGKINKESLPRLKAALVKSMGVNVSDGEAETGTEPEDNVPRPTPVESQPNLHSSDKKSSSSSGSKNSSSLRSTTSSSSGRKTSSYASSGRKSTFFISSEGMDREVITTDICRYLGNDALVKPGIYQDVKTGKSQVGFYITAYRPPTSEQLADLRADSQKWREERKKNSNRVPGGYDQSVTKQEARMRGNLNDPVLPTGYTPMSYGMLVGQQASSQTQYYHPQPSGSPAMTTPPESVGYYSRLINNYQYSLPGYLNPLTPSTSDQIPESRPQDENMPDQYFH